MDDEDEAPAAAGGEVEHHSLEYMEDPYFIRLDGDATPSLDEVDPDAEDTLHCWTSSDGVQLDREIEALRVGPPLTTVEDEGLCIETEFYVDNRKRTLRIFRRKLKDVRVTFQDLSKPYLARMTSNSHYKKFLGLTPEGEDALGSSLSSPIGDGYHVSSDDELKDLPTEEAERIRAEWRAQLATTEDEIATLRTVLAAKIRLSSELKRKLGITVWKELTEDVNQGIKNVKESHVYQNVESHVGQIARAVTEAPIYQKTESAIKTTAEKTTSLLGGITGGITSKLGQMRNSESFRSIEERVGYAYENVKGKVGSRSGSVQSFDEALREVNRATSPSTVTSPTIPENKPLQ